MYQSTKDLLARWDAQTTDRQKLQHTYIALASALLVVAGILGLLNQPLGQQVLAFAIASAAAFLINAVAWALLQSFVLLRLTIQPKKPESKLTVKKRKK